MKRLVILCDGNWLDGAGARPGNVAEMAGLVLPRAADGTHQLIHHYLPGALPADAVALGATLDHDIQALYRFLVLNHEAGDEIYLFGFSRGAYTVRSLVGLLRNSWLLRREHVALVPQAYHVYRTLWYADADNALRFREPHAREVRVRFLGVWDTAGPLGIPFELFPDLDPERYAFHDTVLSRIVDNACHALAIDERRKPFAPAIWKTRGDRTRTEQAWFAGSHLDLGGACPDAGLAQASLHWMVEQATRCGLELDQRRLARIGSGNTRAPVHAGVTPRERVFGLAERAIGTTNADETLHPSAEQRYLHARRYRPRNLVEYLARDEQIRLPL